MNIGIRYNHINDLPEELSVAKYCINKKPIFPFSKKGEISILKNIQKINFFVGANNSGKSRFLRGLFKLENNGIELFCREKPLTELYTIILSDLDKFLTFSSSSSKITSLKRIFHELINVAEISRNKDLLSHINGKSKNYEEINKTKEKFYNHNRHIENGYLLSTEKKQQTFLKSAFDKICDFIEEVNFHQNHERNKKSYIPILRYSNANDNLRKDSYKITIEKNYGIKEHTFTGLDLYDILKKLQGEEKPIRKNKKNFEKFLSQTFFNNEDVEITPSSQDSNKILFEIGGDEKPLYDLGDGLQAIILLMFPLFNANKNDWIFIDEPENHLHPGFQKIFFKTILHNEVLKKKNLKLFITTHSNHFLDASIINEDVSIFQFDKIDTNSFSIDFLKKPSIDTLNILGVSNSSVLIANSSIWVEGPTDRKYVSFWLYQFALYKEESPLIEDINFAFFEYGGNLLAHYLFDDKFDDSEETVKQTINSFALSNHIYLLADNDNVDGRSKKAQRRKELEKQAKNKSNFKYQNTQATEIENLLPAEIIKNFSQKLLIESSDFQKIKSSNISKKDYENKRLGDFYEKLFASNKIAKEKQRKFMAPSGTLTTDYKFQLCEFAINSKYSYTELIKDNKLLDKIISGLYNFIKNPVSE